VPAEVLRSSHRRSSHRPTRLPKPRTRSGQQVSGIQNATKESVLAIKAIGDTIGRMSEIASTIAAAVEGQGATT
jgi:hypothetical protein